MATKTKTNSFLTKPPVITIRGKSVQLRAVNHGFKDLCEVLGKLVKKKEGITPAIVVGYAVVYSLPPDKAYALLRSPKQLEKEIGVADHELLNEDIRAVDSYLAGVIERTQAAKVTIEKGGARGKSPRATRPKSSQRR